MMKTIKSFFLIILISCFSSCKDESNLGDHYFYLPDYESIDIGYPYGSIIYVSKEKNKFDKILIYADLKKINSDDDYVIAQQYPNKKLMIQNIEDELNLWSNYYLENKKDSIVNLICKNTSIKEINKLVENTKKERLNVIVDSIFDNDVLYKKMFRNKINYYIIQKDREIVFGPLTLKEFEAIKKKKSIDLDFE